ncbi:MAG: phosphoglycerate kinase [Pelagibacteraceae bacterium]|nr:phosphoglycerate kinase [Pelagibacteraceae bacterium]MBO6483089.1 phosphoglycerate kinase [Pelagibacteraceae bacterium]MBO6487107.1 phosphoglycerate kinase [Pelagibacteraceae bacterium]MBO6488272.1 phosphoglycerate kinase [Pelagibacteraceae bacterium]
MSDLKIFSSDISVSGKRVIVRLDLNVPINNSKIDDDTRIKVIEPFVNKLIENKAKVILLSHLGRPKGKVVSELSLKPIFNYLEKKLNGKIYFYQEKIDSKAVDASNKLKPGEVLLFENIRFFKEEEGDEETFAKNLSRLGDIYINEAFSCSHRKQASIHKITRFIDSYGGPLLEKEIQSINLIIKNKKKPVTCIIGGSKVSTKINILSSLSKKADNLVIVGAMANNFLKFKGINVGKSLIEEGSENIVKNINTLAAKNKCNIIIPVDWNTSSSVNGDPVYKSLKDMGSEDMILDIGKSTIDLISKTIDNSNTVFWNGPAGYYENKNFSTGTLSIANKIAENTKSKSLISIVGGGDTVAAIKNTGLENVFTHLSTAGGAFLESLEGKELPGIKVLKKN